MGQFTHNGVVYEELPNGKVRPVAYANPLAGATPVGGPDPTKPLDIAGKQLSNARAQQELNQAPVQQQGQVLSNQRTAQDIQFERSKVAADLANKYNNDQRVIEYRTVLPQVASAMAATPGKQGDLSVVYAWAKTMDPTGSVREGDTDMANSTSSYVQRAQQWVASINQGKGLPKAVRDGLIAEMRNKGHQLGLAYVQARQDYAKLAQQGQIPANVVIGQNDSAKYDPVEAKYRESLPNGGKTQTKFAEPHDFDRILSDMIEQGKPVTEIRQTLKDYGSTLPPYQEKILDQYEAARVSGQPTQIRVDTLPGADVGLGLAKGFKGAWDRAAVGTQDAYNAVVPQSMESNSASQAQQQSQQYFQGVNTDPTAETMGRLGGATLFSAPLTNPMLAGAAGNLMMTDSTGFDAVKDAAFGAAGGKLADVALRGGAQLLSPQLDQSVSNLAREGARLTPGRFFPGLKKAEDLARSYPVVGGKIDDAMSNAEATVSQIPARRALSRIGQELPGGVMPGHATVGHTEDAIGDVYNQSLNGRTVALDPTLITRLNYAGQRSPLRPQEFEQFNDIVQREVGGLFANGLGRASARNFKRLDSKLGKMASKLQSSPDDPFRVQLGDHVEFLQEQMRHLLRRQNPDIADSLRAADSAWADFVPYQRAAGATLDGIPSPNQFKSAVRQNDSSLRKGSMARGEARMQDFAIDANKVIPAERGNSGTADRLNVTSPKAWALGTALSPLYSEPSINLLNMLAKRKPDKVSETIANLVRLPHTRGMFGAGLPLWLQSGN